MYTLAVHRRESYLYFYQYRHGRSFFRMFEVKKKGKYTTLRTKEKDIKEERRRGH